MEVTRVALSTVTNSSILGKQFVRNVSHTANGTLFYAFNNRKVKGLKLGASTLHR